MCYLRIFTREMVDKLPSPHTYLLLGDAYISIQEVRQMEFMNISWFSFSGIKKEQSRITG